MGERGTALSGERAGSSPAIFFLMIFGRFLGKNIVLKVRILGNPEFQKTVIYVTGRPNILRPSRQEVTNDVLKYLQDIVIGLYAVCEQKLAHPDRVPSPHPSTLHSISTVSVVSQGLNG